ncbi:MAG: hypothetical protein H3C43_10330 [Leptonema sp. (in: Bacteria)]|nr:hypothetical protein [Leptonema sp. (in: bacteria)]
MMQTAPNLLPPRKDPFISLPSTIILTGAGMKFLGSNPSVQKVSNREGAHKEGLLSPSFNAQTVQKLIMKSMIEEIYVTQPELLSMRSAIISTNNLIVYAILYRKLSPALAKALFESRVVKDFNRKNPKHSIVDLKHVSQQKVEALQKQQVYAARLADIKRDIRELVTERILSSLNLTDEDIEARVKSLPKFIEWVDPRIWFVFYIIYNTDFKVQITNVFVNMLAAYLDHTRIATHLSNLLMEFVQNSEKAHLERIAVKNSLSTRDNIDKFIRSRENREVLKKISVHNNELIDLSWNMNPDRIATHSLSRIQIQVSNYGLIDESTAQRLARKMKSDVEGINLASFYSEGSADQLGAGLGLLYNSYLEEICRKEGIPYRVSIFPEPKKERTTVKIDMTL